MSSYDEPTYHVVSHSVTGVEDDMGEMPWSEVTRLVEIEATHTLTITPVKRPVTLNLTCEEAKALIAILSRVGGDSKGSRRKFVDSIHAQLRERGSWKWDDLTGNGDDVEQSSGFYFLAPNEKAPLPTERYLRSVPTSNRFIYRDEEPEL